MSRSGVAPSRTFRPKWLDLQAFGRGLRLAIPLAVLVCALPDAGCMVPQSIDPITAQPHPPPQFLVAEMPTSVTGVPQLQLFTQGTQDGNCHCELDLSQLFVFEADPTIDLTVRWFLDYNLSVGRSISPLTQEVLGGTFDNPAYTRRQLTDFHFDAANLAIATSGSHVLEAVVGESGGFNDAPTAALPNRTMLQGFIPAVYRFFINVTVEPVVGSCAQSGPPAVRVCPP